MRQAARITAVLAAAGMAVVGLTTSSSAQSVNDQSVQATSPSAARPVAAAADDHGDTVYVTSKAKDGTVSTMIYDPAKGVTPDQLRDKLRRSGVTGVLDKGQEPPTKQPSQTQDLAEACLSYGTARQLCGRRWDYGLFRDPQVYFLDHTSSAWPVRAAVTVWNEAVGIDSYYRWFTDGCPSGRHCVDVYNGRYGDTGWYGRTRWDPGTQGPVTVQLNDSYPLDADGRRTVTCHELGHALALDHNTAYSSCMRTAWESQRPNSHDFELLKRIYPLAGT